IGQVSTLPPLTRGLTRTTALASRMSTNPDTGYRAVPVRRPSRRRSRRVPPRSAEVERAQVVLAETGGPVILHFRGERLDVVVVRHGQDRHLLGVELLDPLVVRKRLLAGGGEDRGIELLVELVVLELAEVGRAGRAEQDGHVVRLEAAVGAGVRVG